MVVRASGLARHARRQTLEFYLGISPWLIGVVCLTVGPLLASLVFSFSDWDIISTLRWIGVDNYREMLTHDPLFWTSLRVTAFYSMASVPLRLAYALFLALLLNQPIRGKNLLRAIFYLPAVTSGIAVAMLWRWIFNPELGLLNSFLWLFHIKGPLWIYSPHWVIPSMILMSIWGMGSALVIFIAGLQGVPQPLYEAAEVDGAHAWHRFWHITLPMLSPVILFNLVMGIIDSFQVFTPGFAMTEGGPLNSSLFMVLYLYYKGFRDFHMGYASALAWVLFVIILTLTILQFLLSRRWVYYEQ